MFSVFSGPDLITQDFDQQQQQHSDINPEHRRQVMTQESAVVCNRSGRTLCKTDRLSLVRPRPTWSLRTRCKKIENKNIGGVFLQQNNVLQQVIHAFEQPPQLVMPVESHQDVIRQLIQEHRLRQEVRDMKAALSRTLEMVDQNDAGHTTTLQQLEGRIAFRVAELVQLHQTDAWIQGKVQEAGACNQQPNTSILSSSSWLSSGMILRTFVTTLAAIWLVANSAYHSFLLLDFALRGVHILIVCRWFHLSILRACHNLSDLLLLLIELQLNQKL